MFCLRGVSSYGVSVFRTACAAAADACFLQSIKTWCEWCAVREALGSWTTQQCNTTLGALSGGGEVQRKSDLVLLRVGEAVERPNDWSVFFSLVRDANRFRV